MDVQSVPGGMLYDVGILSFIVFSSSRRGLFGRQNRSYPGQGYFFDKLCWGETTDSLPSQHVARWNYFDAYPFLENRGSIFDSDPLITESDAYQPKELPTERPPPS